MRKIVLIAVLAAISGPVEQSPAKAEQVSLMQLVARPADFDGKRVRVIGYVTTEHETQALFVNPEEFENSILDNCVKLTLANGQEMPLTSDEYAVVEGIFHARTPSHDVRFGVADIDSITRLEPWSLSKKERTARAAKTRSCFWWW